MGKVTLPDGKEHELHNGDRGFFVRHVHKLRVLEGFRYRFRPIRLVEGLEVGKRGFNSFPPKLDVSKHHCDIAVVNNYYFMKDAGSKYGTFIKIGGSKENSRIELHKGMTFSVGRLHLKVQNIEGDCADNKELKAKLEAERAAKEQEKSKDTDKKPDDELDEDEEYADDTDDEDDKKGSSAKKGKLDGPAVMFLVPLNKKEQAGKGRIRETSTIGISKEKNKVSVSDDQAKKFMISDVHTKIVLEDGHFYLENAGGAFGTYVGLPKKKYFELHGGDQLLLGGARAQVEAPLGDVPRFFPLDGLIDKILGKQSTKAYNVTVTGKSNIENRLINSRGGSK